MSKALRQTAAIFVDAYRELNATKLFWIVLFLSGAFVAAAATLGVTPEGVTFLHLEWKNSLLNEQVFPDGRFYTALLFEQLGVTWWLTRIATVLALISTAGIFPTLITSGSIDLVLSKPISRARLFFTKYLTGLLFVTLQVTVFCGASFLVIGFRGESWEPGIFIAVPIVVLFFSYLYCVCVLLGLLTRSTIASLLITILLWIGTMGLNTVDSVSLQIKIMQQLRFEQGNSSVNAIESRLMEYPAQRADLERSLGESQDRLDQLDPGDQSRTRASREVTRLETQLRNLDGIIESETEKRDLIRAALPGAQSSQMASNVNRVTRSLKLALPKTAETIGLLRRSLTSLSDIEAFFEQESFTLPPDATDPIFVSPAAYTMRMEEIQRSRSAAWIIGTSLAFQAVILGICCVIFCRRDF